MSKPNTNSKTKKIVVFGANGKVGSLVVYELLNRGYSVRAFVYGKHSFEDDNKLEIVQGNVKNKEDVNSAIIGADIVVCTLGSWGTKTKDVLSSGIKNIIPSMRKHDVVRIISLTGSDAWMPNEKRTRNLTIFHKFVSIFVGKIIKDGEDHLRQLEASKLDWTVIRSPIMRSKYSKEYVLNDVACSAWETIPRRAVVEAIVDMVQGDEYSREAPFIHR